jgi:hypothetical protein
VTKVPVLSRVSIVSSVPVSPRLDHLTPSWNRTTIDAEAVGGLTSDQSSSAIPDIHRLSVCPLGRPHRRSDGYSTARKSPPWQPSQPPGTEHDGPGTSSHHTTHIAAPQREFGCRIPPSGTCTLPGLGQGKYKYKYNPK